MSQVIVQINLEMTESIYDRLLPTLEALGDIQKDRHVSLSGAAKKYGWSETTLRRWAKKGLIPFTQKVERGTIFFLASDLRKFAAGQIQKKPVQIKVKRIKTFI